ncbi:beta-galactoside alpha-2,6-sialyltransferase 2-like isoform X2 [Salvelinus fontinalis]|uniref:beta-galactoside alpha-2,6-sialyltransferase 2-like isoform X2 n=1 Tax=Salvelinus fontinalis TaxID=8038 RepID=UPI002484F081|nr:beta-galactoside alpha-2,6-sialyltransferase 2-like isoform X2 [Salvelinus fontinalis]
MTPRTSTMIPTMKQWRQLVLVVMLAWLLIFLALLSHFLDPRDVDLRSPSSLTHTETRRLASIQGSTSGIRASPLGVSSSSSPANQDPSHSRQGKQEALELSQNGDSVVWKKVSDQEEGVDQEREEKIRRERLRRRRRKRSMSRAEQRGRDGYYLSQSKAVVQQLRRGIASAGMLAPHLQKSMRDYQNLNRHHVAYRGLRRGRQSGREVLCELKEQARLRTLDGTEQPFSGLAWERLVPTQPLEQLWGQGSKFKSCAVVTSAGAILNSSLGREIDSHEAVLRFNAAPTEGYENDVGNKTTIRIINSQWYRNPDYDLFTPYEERRRLHPTQPFYILHPKFIWQLWDVIQGNTQENIQPNPPSSGFIGIVLMMSLCEEVHVYEYIPSLRQTDLCHYHEHYYDAACTLGAYHPLLFEKQLVQRMNSATQHDLKTKGKVTLSGFSAVNCGH